MTGKAFGGKKVCAKTAQQFIMLSTKDGKIKKKEA